MEANTILVLSMFITFMLLLFTGFPIAFVLVGVSILFTAIGYFSDMYMGTMTGLGFTSVGMMISRIFAIMSNWVLVAIPMFVFMGLMLDQSGIAEKMMHSLQELFGKVRGGLAITVALIGVILAASTGIIGASVVLLGLISLPTMLNQNYNKSLAAGTVCASGTLGILIPPSIMLVVMADQLAIPVGDLFMGAFIPGLILGLLYIIYLLVHCLLKPNDAPLSVDRRALTWRIVWDVFKTVLPPFGLIIAVLGSIFAGICTATEASAVGAFGATFLAWYNKKLNIKVLRKVVKDTFSTMGYVFAIFLCANCFALVLRLLGGDEVIGGFITNLPLGPYGILIVVMLMVFLLGFFLDWMEISFIVLPILAAAVTSLDFNINGFGVVEKPVLVWFTVLIAMCLQTSFLTPPVGFAIFYLKGACPPEIKLIDIYKGVIPFVIVQLIGLLIVIIWPELVTWLPAVAYATK